MDHTITVLPQKKKLKVPHGKILLHALRDDSLAPDAPCGGNGTCGKCKVTVNGSNVQACGYRVESDLTVLLSQTENTVIPAYGETANVSPDSVKEGYLAAFDIGTTTVVCFLLSPDGKELAAESMRNPQSAYGADVISRIRQALGGEMEALTQTIRNGMCGLMDNCCEKAGIDPEQIGVVSVVGNPCMQQLFLGISPKNLAAVPFAPVLNKAQICSAADIFPGYPNACLLTVPDISGYVGADTMACVLASGMYEKEETILMVDIGTNGEMVLSHKGDMIACSTAAGPALEGANIRFGMRAAAGAIDHVWAENGKIQFSVIGDCAPSGICGSGIIDAVATLLDQKLLNKRGRIQSTEGPDGQRIVRLSEHIYLTQEDIRQVQLAKGAIAAGIHLMCAHLGITPGQIDQVILAGAFGTFLDPENACRIELLPKALSGKIRAAGNLAGTGAKRIAADKAAFFLTQALLQRIHFLELAQMPAFQRTFAKCMMFSE